MFSGRQSSDRDTQGHGQAAPTTQQTLHVEVGSFNVQPITDALQPKLQPQLLKQINALNSKEELLAYVERCHHLLDVINLVTCLYRLARIYVAIPTPAQKVQWKAGLLDGRPFLLLLGCIHSHLLQGVQSQAAGQPELHGLNARCLSNLIWSLVKLEVVADDNNSIVTDVVAAASPLVLVLLPDCSGQGLANLLWSYAKIPSAPPSVMIAIVGRMVQLLQEPSSSNMLDAQALSNSIWAIAHVRTRNNSELESLADWQEVVTSFLLLMAHQCLNLLTRVMGSAPAVGGHHHHMSDNHVTFSCQALVNIVWSFSSILGSACGVQDPISTLFLLIRRLAVAKLRSMLGGLQLDQPWVYSLSGSFNEQALSNLVYAFEKAQLLDTELLQGVFDCAAQLLIKPTPTPGAHVSARPLAFKPQELCTLLRACHLGLANHQKFLGALSHILMQHPMITSSWSTSELADLDRAMQLLGSDPSAALPPVGLQQSLSAPQTYYPPMMPQVHNMPYQQNAASSLLGLTQQLGSMQLSPSASLPATTAALPVAPVYPQQGVTMRQVWVCNTDGHLAPVNLIYTPRVLSAPPLPVMQRIVPGMSNLATVPGMPGLSTVPTVSNMATLPTASQYNPVPYMPQYPSLRPSVSGQAYQNHMPYSMPSMGLSADQLMLHGFQVRQSASGPSSGPSYDLGRQ